MLLRIPLADQADLGEPFDAAAEALRRIEQRLKRRDVAAFVMEPISINLGALIPEFACEHFDLGPGMLCVAKGNERRTGADWR